jgi:hypothetical protein
MPLQVSENKWVQGAKVRGEGVYVCANSGACIAPDTCTCADGWSGFDCQTPLCRHLQPSGAVSACQNGGVCGNKDDCTCIQVRWYDALFTSRTLLVVGDVGDCDNMQQ